MAIAVVQEWSGTTGMLDLEVEMRGITAGNWVLAIISWRYQLPGIYPTINVQDAPRNVWTLLETRTISSNQTYDVATGTLNVQVWACPGALFDGWPWLYSMTSVEASLANDLLSCCIKYVEISGMGNNYLTVDSITPGMTGLGTTLSITTPTPTASANCLFIADLVTDNNTTSTMSVTSPGWTNFGTVQTSGPNVRMLSMWRSGTASVNAAWSSTVSLSMVGVVVAIRASGVAPTQLNPNWPAVEAQLGFGQDLSQPLTKVHWADQSRRYWALNHKRGIQYELGQAQAEPTVVTWRNDDGALSHRSAGFATATGTGTTTTFVCSSTDAGSFSVGDYVKITYAPRNTNPSFSSGTTGWTATGTSSFTVIGGTTAQLVPTGAAATVQLKNSTHVTVTPNEVYTVSAFIQNDTTRAVSLNLIWLDGAAATIRTDSITYTVTSGIPKTFTGSFVAPSNAASADIAPTMTGTPPAVDILYLDDVTLNPAQDTVTYQISAITTTGGTSTIALTSADGTGTVLRFAPIAGDTMVGVPIDIYTPYRVLMSWGGKRHYVSSGWIERWPQQWRDPHWGTVASYGIGAIATLTAANPTAYAGEIARRYPYAWWSFGDALGSAQAQNVAGRSTAPLLVTESKNGPGSGITITGPPALSEPYKAEFGAELVGFNADPANEFNGQPPFISSFLGDPKTGWWQTGLNASDLNGGKGTCLIGKDAGFPTITNGVTVVITVLVAVIDQEELDNAGSGTVNVNPTLFILKNTDRGSGVGQGAIIKIDRDRGSSGQPAVTVWDKDTHASTRTLCASGHQILNDFLTITLVFDRTSWVCYTDATQAGSGSADLVANFGQIDVCGEADQFFTGLFFPGLITNLAIFDRKLSSGEITRLVEAGKSAFGIYIGNPTEYTGYRVERKLDTVNMKIGRMMDYSGAVLLDGEGTDGTTIADICNLISQYEDAYVFEDAGAVYQYRAPGRYAYQFPRATLGERSDLGELPYLGDIESDFDPTYLYNQVTTDNTVFNFQAFSTTVSSSTFTALDDTSAAKYGLRTVARATRIFGGQNFTVPGQGLEAIFYLNYWLLTNYANPRQRFQTVTLDPAGNPNLWQFCLTVEVADIVVVKRRPIGAPTISETCVILQVTHDGAPGNWRTTLTLAPARSSGLVLDDTIKGIVGTNYLTMQ